MQSALDIQLQPRPQGMKKEPWNRIRENRRITVEEVAGRLNVSVGSAYSLIHDSLQFSKVCARWVPTELTERKRKRLRRLFPTLGPLS